MSSWRTCAVCRQGSTQSADVTALNLAAIVRSARETYEQLFQRQHSLKLPPDDAEMVRTMLERIKARLRFLS